MVQQFPKLQTTSFELINLRWWIKMNDWISFLLKQKIKILIQSLYVMTNYHKFQIYLIYEAPLLEFKSTLASLSKLDHDDCTCFISYSFP